MATHIPSPAQVRRALARLDRQGVLALAQKSGVPFGTLNKIRRGETTDPHLSKVHAFWRHVVM